MVFVFGLFGRACIATLMSISSAEKGFWCFWSVFLGFRRFSWVSAGFPTLPALF